MTAASNFFWRYTSTAQDGIAKQTMDPLDPIVEFKTLKEASFFSIQFHIAWKKL